MSPAGLPNMADPVQAAVKVATIEAGMAAMQSRMSEGFLTMSSRLDAVQADMREQTRTMGELARQQHDFQAHSEGLNRLAKAIEDQGKAFTEWRDRHEQGNQLVADKVTRFNGMFVGFGMLATLVAGGSVAWISDQFTRSRAEGMERAAQIRTEFAASQQYQSRDRDRIETKFDKEIAAIRAEQAELRKLGKMR